MDEEPYPQQRLPLPIRSGGLMVMSSALGGSLDGRHPPAAAPRSPLTIRPLLHSLNGSLTFPADHAIHARHPLHRPQPT